LNLVAWHVRIIFLLPRSFREFGAGVTVWIDKNSSAELSEAINSMFEWYRKAEVCYAYLADVPARQAARLYSTFRRSRWFERGWTLQELLAPTTVVFYDEEWREIGTKSSLSKAISSITGISPSDMVRFADANVAVKMSWASKRRTTRIEDIAYSLMGLFGVNMPLLYGEGKNAFIRLQLEIIKMSDDETIFAWSGSENSGLLAPSPSAFYLSGDVRQIHFDKSRPLYSMTNKGLQMELLLQRATKLEAMESKFRGKEVYLAPLNCTRHPEGYPLAIYLQRGVQNEGNDSDGFTRCGPTYGPWLPTTEQEATAPMLQNMERKTVYVKQIDAYSDRQEIGVRQTVFSVRHPPLLYRLSETHVTGFEASENPLS
jgi:hypothetical protein